MIALDTWHTPATDYPRARHGCAKIVTKHYPRGTYDCYMQRGHKHYRASRRLAITGLEIDGEVWMVDDPPHWWAMQEHARAYSGNVLCAGLGLGLMVHTLDANPNVERIVVVERVPDVIALVAPRLPQRKLTIITADFHKLNRGTTGPVSGVLYDLLVGDARQLWNEALAAADLSLQRWGSSAEFVVRVHGFPNPLIQNLAEARQQASELLLNVDPKDPTR